MLAARRLKPDRVSKKRSHGEKEIGEIDFASAKV